MEGRDEHERLAAAGPAADDWVMETGRGEELDLERFPADEFTTNHMSPMGQVVSLGGNLQTGLAAGGWRRKAVRTYVWLWIALGFGLPVLILLVIGLTTG